MKKLIVLSVFVFLFPLQSFAFEHTEYLGIGIEGRNLKGRTGVLSEKINHTYIFSSQEIEMAIVDYMEKMGIEIKCKKPSKIILNPKNKGNYRKYIDDFVNFEIRMEEDVTIQYEVQP